MFYPSLRHIDRLVPDRLSVMAEYHFGVLQNSTRKLLGARKLNNEGEWEEYKSRIEHLGASET